MYYDHILLVQKAAFTKVSQHVYRNHYSLYRFCYIEVLL